MSIASKPMKPMVLIILDGWGHADSKKHNPTQAVKTPTIDYLFKNYPNLLIEASGEAVGLPKGQMGNSEVGHLHLGAGRKVPQDLTRIQNDVSQHAFSRNSCFSEVIQLAKKNNSAVHILGLLSPGGVHSHEDQICEFIQLLGDNHIEKNYFHAILDGRDTPPKSAQKSLERVEKLYAQLPGGQIASIIGRYYAMDRDKRWDRTQKAYDLLTLGSTNTAKTALDALESAYQKNETDEFISPTSIADSKNNKLITINNNDIVVFMNFRADRARQLTRALTEPHFDFFTRQKIVRLDEFVTLTEYLENPLIHVAYPPLKINNTLGEYLSSHHLSQLRLAETEKYAHVTYFFNGGIEAPFPNETRELVASPAVATYDLQPEMSAYLLTDKLVSAIENKQYDAIICNYANPDMVGHTGDEKAAEKAVLVIDECLKKVLAALEKTGGEALITADHGNIEQMFDEKTNQPHTAHTTNLVPLIYVGRKAEVIKKTGALDDVAPTLLYLMGLTIPKEMTGHVLFKIIH